MNTRSVEFHSHMKFDFIYANRSISQFLSMPVRFSIDLQVEYACMMDQLRDRVNIGSYISVLQTLGQFYLLPCLQYIYTERNEPQLLFFGSPLFHAFRVNRRAKESTYIQSFLDRLPSTSPKTIALFIESPWREHYLHAISRMPELEFLVMDSEEANDRLSLGTDFMTNFASRQTLSLWCLFGNISVAPPPAGFSVSIFHTLVYISLISGHPAKETSITEYATLFRVRNFPSLQKIEINLTVDHTLEQPPSPKKLAQFLQAPSLYDHKFAFRH